MRAAVARTLALEFSVGFLVALGALERDELGLREHAPVPRHLRFQRFEALLTIAKSWRSHTQRTPRGGMNRPLLATELVTLQACDYILTNSSELLVRSG